MKRARTQAMSIALVAISSLSMASPVNAQGFWQQLPSMMDVDARQLDLNKRLADAITSGRLTVQQAQPYKDELKRIADLETQFKADGKLSVWESMRLTYVIDTLSKQIEANLGERTVPLTDIDGRQAQIEKSVSDAVVAGRLTQVEANDFKKEFDRIATQETQYKADGSLNSTELLTLSLDLDRLSANIEKTMRDRQIVTDVDVKQTELEKRIVDGHAAGRISTAQADELRQELNRIATLESNYTVSGGVLTTEEKLLLAIDLERLNARVSQYMPASSTAATSIDGKQEEIARRILDAQTSGRVTTQTAAELKLELDRIAERENLFRSDGVLNDAETTALSGDLDTLKGRIDRWLTALPDISSKQVQLDRKITDGMASGRLAPQTGAAMKQSLQRVANLETTMKTSENRLDDQELATLNHEYDELARSVDSALTPLPDIERMMRRLERRMSEASSTGKLPQSRYSDLRQELDRIASAEASFRQSDNTLADWESITLGRDLDRLKQSFDAAVAAAPPPAVTQPPVTTVPVNTPPIFEGPVAPDTRGHWAEPYVASLSGRSIIGGFPDGSFRPNDDITRAQFAAIAIKALSTPPAAGSRNFTDVPERHWAGKAIAAASNAGLITGFPDGTFKPEDKITRAQALVILAKALHNQGSDAGSLNRYSDAQAVPAWAQPSVTAAANAHIIVNYPDPSLIRPNALATRAEVAALVYQTMVNIGANLPPLKIGVLSGSQ